MKFIAVFFSGLLFSLGLIVSGMTNPAKVIGFLDIFGNWDLSLAFVMVGGILVTSIGFRILKKLEKPVYAMAFSIPTRKDIDQPLVVGAAIFGVGWGLVGLCPGPAVAALVIAPNVALVFFMSMLAGMAGVRIVQNFVYTSPNSDANA